MELKLRYANMRLAFVISIRELSFNVKTRIEGLFMERIRQFPKNEEIVK